MDNHGYPWRSMHIHEIEMFLHLHGYPWISIYPWICMDMNEFSWPSMCFVESPMDIMWISMYSKQNAHNIPRSIAHHGYCVSDACTPTDLLHIPSCHLISSLCNYSPPDSPFHIAGQWCIHAFFCQPQPLAKWTSKRMPYLNVRCAHTHMCTHINT